MKGDMGCKHNTHFYKFQIGMLIGSKLIMRRMVTTGLFWQYMVEGLHKVLHYRLPLEMQKFLAWGVIISLSINDVSVFSQKARNAFEKF
jgi:hypothetical protein